MGDYVARYLEGEGIKHLVRNGVAACGREPTSSDLSGWHGGLRVEQATKDALPLCRQCDVTQTDNQEGTTQ